jgi:AcrR family transcriptional regulator
MIVPTDQPRGANPPGRPRDPAISGEVLRVTQQLLAEVGYDLVTLEQIAARAKVTKPTIYRRWATKAELVIDAVRNLGPPPDPPDPPDLGSVIADLRAARESAAGIDDFVYNVTVGLAGAVQRHPDLARVFHEQLVAPRLRTLRTIFERGIARGEITADCDVDLLATVFPSMLSFHLLLGPKPPDRTIVKSIFENILVPLTTGLGKGEPSPRKR